MPNSVSINKLTDGSSRYEEHWRDPVAIFDVLSVCLIVMQLRNELSMESAVEMSKENVCGANVWLAAMGYQAEIGETQGVPEGAISVTVNDKHDLWFRHKDSLGNDVLSWRADRSLVKHLSSPPTLDGPFAWYRTATQEDPQAARQLVNQLSEASRFFLRDEWGANWMWHSYRELVPYLNGSLIKTTLMTPEEVSQQQAFFQGKFPKPALLQMDTEAQQFLLLEINQIEQETEGPIDESEDMISKLDRFFRKPGESLSVYQSRPGSPMKRVR